MPRNGLPPHCSWEIDRHGKRRIRFRWRKVSRSITGTPGEAKQQARQQQNDLAAQRSALEAKMRQQDRKTRPRSARLGAGSANHEGRPKGSPPPRLADERKQ
jgi:hypothetical protein